MGRGRVSGAIVEVQLGVDVCGRRGLESDLCEVV